MRAFDSWNSYLDNDGNLLHGKIRFCRKGTTDDIVIRNSDGAPIRNPEFTDMLGRTEYQVFVDSVENVSAYFYKYIGTGDMTTDPEDYDPSRWAYQYSSDNMDPADSVHLTADTANGVGTISDLRAVNPEQVPEVYGQKLLWVYGYYASGDTSPVLYIWDSSCAHSDDGGAYIQSTSVPGNGRWVLATRELHFDVRHYGIFPTDDIYSTDIQYTSQMANCAAYLNDEGLDAWFPALNDNISYYLFSGSNTFSIKGDIYVSDAVRMHCISGTSGTAISCKELHKSTPGLFVSNQQTGTGTLTADWICISWVGGQIAGNARVGWIIDTSNFYRTITGKEVKFIANGHSSLQLDNCVITSNKRITGRISISNSVLRTDFFADDYSWGNLASVGNTILLENCKDANTYVLLKNKQGEANYGDLGEQNLSNTALLAGAIAENATFTNVSIQGATELHNVSGTVTVADAGTLELNALDCWLTLSGSIVAASVALRRGMLSRNDATSTLQVINNVFLDKVTVGIPMTTLGATTEFRGCDIDAPITATDIKFSNCQVRATVDQRDYAGTINVSCVGNMFHGTAQHYIHATTENTVVNGIWANNGSSYDDKHWILLDRTNLKVQDNDHHYTYSNNSEPYLMKYSGRNHPMRFPVYRANRNERDLYRTTTIPFICINDATYVVFCVPRGNCWKCFSVGRGFLARSGTLRGTWHFGILESSYSEHTTGDITIVYTWGAQATTNPALLDGQAVGYSMMSSRDGDGIASYDVSFEPANADHNPDTSPGGVYSNGAEIGVLTRTPYDGWGSIVRYPATPGQVINLFVYIDPDFQAGSTTPQNYGS
jgi:hypothetical protein